MNSFEYRALERERFLYIKLRELMVAQSWLMLQSLVFIGITIFSLILAVGGLAQIARWFQVLQTIQFPLPAAFGFPEFVSASSTLPSPQFVNALSRFPLWGVKDATLTALIVMSLVLVFRLWKGMKLWRDIRIMRITIREIDEQLERLRHSADDER